MPYESGRREFIYLSLVFLVNNINLRAIFQITIVRLLEKGGLYHGGRKSDYD